MNEKKNEHDGWDQSACMCVCVSNRATFCDIVGVPHPHEPAHRVVLK